MTKLERTEGQSFRHGFLAIVCVVVSCFAFSEKREVVLESSSLTFVECWKVLDFLMDIPWLVLYKHILLLAGYWQLFSV